MADGYFLDEELLKAVQQMVRQQMNSFQPRPKHLRRPRATGASTSLTRQGARVTVEIPAASDNLLASWGAGGEVHLLDPTSGEEDDETTVVINPLQLVFAEDYWVEVDTSFDPPQVTNGSCSEWEWAVVE